ncbi:hypothetical protein [Aneurinibacillus migulanus]|uniref:Uncharacterized protein n=1 Tax=Aneurinibacillus migulanus TaxID=47500 RepID=A0A1G9C1C0_ANEMI|nr:hypothetical protein [Aneurinibacillus migulanus]MED0892016.1 hypothetical protein [Aneurinibacillus migulanus]MED1618346.1 hypothetical protein [Aneurinibacillus migulanus]GED17962.1 hypothetical protein AMI01nite_59530 [Aneurinibacillus migulanus]SDK45470.1 hypothetical protein SAMN04487909_15628 [Aneurinibacillus migulanus]
MVKILKCIATLVISVSLLGTTSVGSATTNSLTEQEKQQYYKQYVEIVEEVMQKKIGIHIEVLPMEQFQPEDWVEPKEYEARIQNMVDRYLTVERETLNALSSTTNKVVRNLNGETTKTTYIYIPDIIREIEVTGKFETQYNAYHDRQVFGKLENISTQAASSVGTWEQTSYEASLIDGGRTYSIRIEGIYSLNGLSNEKAFTIEFHCNEVGKIY